MNDQPVPLAGPYTAFTYGDPKINNPVINQSGALTAGISGFTLTAPAGGGGSWTFVS